AASRLRLDAFELALGHAGIMFQRHRADLFVAGDVAHQPDERRDAADAGLAARQRLDLGADIEILALDADHRSAARDWRENRDLVALLHRMIPADIGLVHRDAQRLAVAERAGEFR